MREIINRTSLWRLFVPIVFSAMVISGCRWQRTPRTKTDAPSANIPFQPKVTYDSSNVIIFNPEKEPYLDTSLNLYVEGTLYSLKVGTILPGESVTRSLLQLTNERGQRYEPNSQGTSELEVRARFGGYDVHKDFPPPTLK